MILPAEVCGCPIEEDLSISNSPICGGRLLFMIILESFIRRNCKISTPCKNVKSIDEVECMYDFIVVGGGPAGSIVAGRLSEHRNNNVLLIEAGGPEPIASRVPGFYRTYWGNKDIDWDYRTVPDDGFCLDQGEKGCQWPRGKVLGGCAVLNGMMFNRGHAADYKIWEEQGAKGWSWKENLKYFHKTEGNKEIGSLVDRQYHSSSGPLPIQRFNHQGPAVAVLLDVLNKTGFDIINDMNDPHTPVGFTVAQAFNDNGQRVTPARAYLKPKSERPNLSVKLHSTVTKVIIEKQRAVGVEFIDKHGNKKTVRAKREVILSAGALNTPHILLLSGIGPRKSLESYNIPVYADLPVGYNLQNHVGTTINFIMTKVNDTRTLDWSVFMKYMLNHDGPMSSTALTQVTGLLYSSLADIENKQPDLQFFFNGLYSECSKTGMIGECADNDQKQKGLNVTANVVCLYPRGYGYLTLQSADPQVPPLFYPRFLSHPDDITILIDGLHHLKKIFDNEILQNLYGIELEKDSAAFCSDKHTTWSNEWMECMIRYHTDPQNHQMGTASMGKVIDEQLRVYGIKGLRVADASSMPSPVTGNPQAAIMMVAERAADFIKRTY